MITTVGNLTIGGTLPGVEAPLLAAEADLDARIAALVGFEATVPAPSYSLDLVLAQQIVTSLQFSITAGIVPPSIALQLALVLSALADLEAQLAAISGLFDLFAVAGVAVYAFDGANNVMGSELATARGPSTAHANALILVADSSVTWSAMSSVFKVEP